MTDKKVSASFSKTPLQIFLFFYVIALFFFLIYAFSVSSFLAFFLPALLGGVGYIVFLLAYNRLELYATDYYAIGTEGLFTTKKHVVPLKKIQSVVVVQSIFGKWFGFGTIVIANASFFGIRFHYVEEPYQFQEHLLAQIRLATDGDLNKKQDESKTSAEETKKAPAVKKSRDEAVPQMDEKYVERVCPRCGKKVLFLREDGMQNFVYECPWCEREIKL